MDPSRTTRIARYWISRVTLALLAMGLTASALAGPVRIYDLGTLGGAYSEGDSVNTNGQVAGYSLISKTPNAFHADLYSGIPGSGGVMGDLGSFGGKSYAFGINSQGQVAGYSYLADNFTEDAFLYTGTPGSGGKMFNLGGGNSEAYGINDSGQVVGRNDFPNATVPHAFLYSGTPGNGGKMYDLGTLGGGFSDASAINAVGQVTGTSSTTTSPNFLPQHAFIYMGAPGAGTMKDIGTLGGSNSFGKAINSTGIVVGESDMPGNAVQHAFVYTPGGQKMLDLGTLGGTTSEATAINASGLIAGDSYTTGNAALDAFLYSGTPGSGGTMIDLNTWLKANDPVDGAAWTLFKAYGLSDTGLVTGVGFYNGGAEHAFLLDASSFLVPEPSAISTLAIFIASLCAHRLLCRKT
jgi:probable HAF family extracellular repeat protein